MWLEIKSKLNYKDFLSEKSASVISCRCCLAHKVEVERNAIFGRNHCRINVLIMENAAWKCDMIQLDEKHKANHLLFSGFVFQRKGRNAYTSKLLCCRKGPLITLITQRQIITYLSTLDVYSSSHQL